MRETFQKSTIDLEAYKQSNGTYAINVLAVDKDDGFVGVLTPKGTEGLIPARCKDPNNLIVLEVMDAYIREHAGFPVKEVLFLKEGSDIAVNGRTPSLGLRPDDMVKVVIVPEGVDHTYSVLPVPCPVKAAQYAPMARRL